MLTGLGPNVLQPMTHRPSGGGAGHQRSKGNIPKIGPKVTSRVDPLSYDRRL